MTNVWLHVCHRQRLKGEFMEKAIQIYIILSIKRTYGPQENLMFWNKNCHGYTDDLSKAGVFTRRELKTLCLANSVPIEITEELNELGLSAYHFLTFTMFKNDGLKVVICKDSDIGGKPALAVVGKLAKRLSQTKTEPI